VMYKCVAQNPSAPSPYIFCDSVLTGDWRRGSGRNCFCDEPWKLFRVVEGTLLASTLGLFSSGALASQKESSPGSSCRRGTLGRACGTVDGDGAESLDKAFGWMLVTPGMWTVTARELRSSGTTG
jgi:hypothetical protein